MLATTEQGNALVEARQTRRYLMNFVKRNCDRYVLSVLTAALCCGCANKGAESFDVARADELVATVLANALVTIQKDTSVDHDRDISWLVAAQHPNGPDRRLSVFASYSSTFTEFLYNSSGRIVSSDPALDAILSKFGSLRDKYKQQILAMEMLPAKEMIPFALMGGRTTGISEASLDGATDELKQEPQIFVHVAHGERHFGLRLSIKTEKIRFIGGK
jgi:hypothetical protein